MLKPAKETTQEWITERMQAVLSSHTPEDVKATLPVILMFMVESFGVENLLPPIRAAVEKVLYRAGIEDGMSAKEVHERMSEYIGNLPVNRTILDELKEIFDVHHAAVAEQRGKGLRRFFGKPRMARPAHVGAAKPINTVNISQLCGMPRRV